MPLTFNDVVTKKLGIRVLKHGMKEVLAEISTKTSKSISQSEYDKFIKIITKGLTLEVTEMNDLIPLFNIYVPTCEQLKKIISVRTANRFSGKIQWKQHLINIGFVFTPELEKQTYTTFYCANLILGKLAVETDNPYENLMFVIDVIENHHFGNEYSIFTSFMLKHKQNISDDELFNICVAIFNKNIYDTYNVLNKMSMFELTVLIAIYNNCKNHLNLTYADVKSLIQYYNEHVKNKKFMYSSGYEKYNDTQDILIEILTVQNNESLIEYMMNNFIQHNKLQNNLSCYIVPQADKHNIVLTSDMLSHACNTGNNVFSKYLMDKNVVPNNECIKCTINKSNINIFKYSINHIKLDEDLLAYACDQNRSEIIKLMLYDAKLKPNIKCVLCAIYCKDEELFKYCIERVNLDDETTITAFHYGTHLMISYLLDTKTIPNTECILATIQNFYGDDLYGILKKIIEHGGELNRTIIKNLVVNGKITKNIYKLGISHDVLFDICHYYCEPDIYKQCVDTILPQQELYFNLHDQNGQQLTEYKEKHNLEFDKYCYDNMLLHPENTFLSPILKTAIDEGKYIPTVEAVLRKANVSERFELLYKYGLNTTPKVV